MLFFNHMGWRHSDVGNVKNRDGSHHAVGYTLVWCPEKKHVIVGMLNDSMQLTQSLTDFFFVALRHQLFNIPVCDSLDSMHSIIGSITKELH
jgi:hypothetical protein